MSNANEHLKQIFTSDTISQFMEKCNDNFATLISMGGGNDGVKGKDGDPGSPTKPKVPIHAWVKGVEYIYESESNDTFEIIGYNDDELTDVKYQEGHLIMLENAHVYILEIDNNDNYKLKPKYLLALHSYNSGDIVNGQPGYVHIAYANSPDGDDFITDQELRNNNSTESIATFNLRNTRSSNNVVTNRTYMGIYSDNTSGSSHDHTRYTWIKIQGDAGERGEKGEQGERGEKGEQGDGYTGHPYTIDLEGDMSTISIDIDRTRIYDGSNDYCECILHAYYGDKNVKLNVNEVTINLPKEYTYSGDDIVLLSNRNSKVGKIVKEQKSKDVAVKFIPNASFVFPKQTIIFSIHVSTTIVDENDKNTYKFDRDTVWMIKGVMSTFELEIVPNHRTIKLFKDGEYYPEVLSVNVYKIEDSERSLFDFNQNTDFTLLYKNYDDNNWTIYPNSGISTIGVSCLEFKVVRYYGSTDPEKTEEMWDYEDVWVVADGKSTHYYHSDLGSTESMMVLTTGDKITYTNKDDKTIECAKLRSESYSIDFDPKFYDGTEELKVVKISVANNSIEEYYTNETFVYKLENEYAYDNVISNNVVTKSTLTISRVPYDVEVIPMNFTVMGKAPVYKKGSNDIEDYKDVSDTVSFNVYISTITNTYSLVPSVSSYNTSTGKTGDTISCKVYKNNTLIETADLDANGLKLKYTIHNENEKSEPDKTYENPIEYGSNGFTADDVAIVFSLLYDNKEIVISTVPLIKDGKDGEDGDSWQYIFCRSSKPDFKKTGISDPSKWTEDPFKNDSSKEYLGNNEDDFPEDNPNMQWYDKHKGVNSEFKYEYQSYRKWNKKGYWNPYGEPTLYSNYSESGSGYSVLLSNPVSVIPVGDDDWSVNENNKTQSDSTLVYLYSNTSDITNNGNVKISLPSENDYVKKGNFKISETEKNKVIFTPVVGDSVFKFEPNTQYKLPITINYNLNDEDKQDFSTTVYWILNPIKGLEDVEVFVDQRVVNTSTSNEHILKVGYYLISSNGTKTFIGSNDKNNKGYQIVLTDDIEDLTSDDVVHAETWDSVKYNFVQNEKNRNCYVVLLDEKNNKLDYVNVTAVNDGKNGTDGVDGLSGVLKLSENTITVHTDSNGNILSSDLSYIGDITYRFFYKNKEIQLSNDSIKYECKNCEIDINSLKDGKIKITHIGTENNTYVKLQYDYNDFTYESILTILKSYNNKIYKLDLTTSNGSNVLDISEDTNVRIKILVDNGYGYEIYKGGDDIKLRINGYYTPINLGTLKRYTEYDFMYIYGINYFYDTNLLTENTTIELLDKNSNIIDKETILITHNIPEDVDKKDGYRLVINPSALCENNTIKGYYWGGSIALSDRDNEKTAQLYKGDVKINGKNIKYTPILLNYIPEKPFLERSDNGGYSYQINFGEMLTPYIPFFDIIIQAEYKNICLKKHFKLKIPDYNNPHIQVSVLEEPISPTVYKDMGGLFVIKKTDGYDPSQSETSETVYDYDVYIGQMNNLKEEKLVINYFETSGNKAGYGLSDKSSGNTYIGALRLNNNNIVSVWDGDNMIFHRNIIDVDAIESGANSYITLANLKTTEPTKFILLDKDSELPNVQLWNIWRFDGFTYEIKYCYLGSIDIYNINSKDIDLYFYIEESSILGEEIVDINFIKDSDKKNTTVKIPSKSHLNVSIIANTETLTIELIY